MGDKGQWYIVMAIFIVIILVLLKTNLNILEILEKKKSLEQGFEKQEFINIKGEVVKTAQLSAYQKQNISRNVENFAEFARNVLKTRVMNFEGFFVGTVYANAAANVDNRINVTVLNLLGRDMTTLNITFSTTTQTFTLPDASSIDTNFTFNIAQNSNFTVTAFYITSAGNSTEKFNVTVEIGKSRFTGFFDVKLKSSRLEQRDKFVETFDLP